MAYYNNSSASGSHPLDLNIEEIDLSKSKTYQESQAYYYNKLSGNKVHEIDPLNAPKNTSNSNNNSINNQRPEVPARPKKYATPQPDSVDAKSPTKVLFNPIQFKSNPGKRQAPRILPKIPDPPATTAAPAKEFVKPVHDAPISSPAPLATPEVFTASKSNISPLKNVSPPKTLPLDKQV